MSQGFSLRAYLAIARMIARTVPFDVELAILLVQEVGRELRFQTEPSADVGAFSPWKMNAAAVSARAGLAQRNIDSVIAEIDRRIVEAAGET